MAHSPTTALASCVCTRVRRRHRPLPQSRASLRGRRPLLAPAPRPSLTRTIPGPNCPPPWTRPETPLPPRSICRTCRWGGRRSSTQRQVGCTASAWSRACLAFVTQVDRVCRYEEGRVTLFVRCVHPCARARASVLPQPRNHDDTVGQTRRGTSCAVRCCCHCVRSGALHRQQWRACFCHSFCAVDIYIHVLVHGYSCRGDGVEKWRRQRRPVLVQPSRRPDQPGDQ